jgi:hypothetical protein
MLCFSSLALFSIIKIIFSNWHTSPIYRNTEICFLRWVWLIFWNMCFYVFPYPHPNFASVSKEIHFYLCSFVVQNPSGVEQLRQKSASNAHWQNKFSIKFRIVKSLPNIFSWIFLSHVEILDKVTKCD